MEVLLFYFVELDEIYYSMDCFSGWPRLFTDAFYHENSILRKVVNFFGHRAKTQINTQGIGEAAVDNDCDVRAQ